MPFDLVKESSPLVIGLDVKKYGETRNMGKQGYFLFCRPHDNHMRKFFTYIAKERNGDERLWIDLLPYRASSL